MKLITLFIMAFLYIFTGCVRDNANMPAVLLGIENDISIEMGDSATLGFKNVKGFDQDGDDMSLYLHTGENYTINGTTVIPDSGFIGDLQVLIQLFDGIGYSNIDTMIISVVTNVVVMPSYKGSWWSYNDTVPASDTVVTSRLEVSDTTISISIDSMTKVAYKYSWSNLASYEIFYLMGNEDDGIHQYAVVTPYDTVIKPQLQYMYPCSLNATWQFVHIKYNVTDSILFEDTTVTMTCTDTAVYVTVPAGIFRCIEYTYQYDNTDDRSNYAEIAMSPLGRRTRDISGIITEKIYYSEGVGYIQNITLSGNTVLWKKVLTGYYVEEK